MNVVKLESLINTAAQIDRVQGSLAVSIAWLLGLKACSVRATIVRLSDEEDSVFSNSRFTPERKAEMIERAERQFHELMDALSWIASFTTSDFRLTGAEIVALASQPRPSSTPAQAVIEAFAEVAGVEVEDAELAMEMQSKQRQQMDELQAAAVKRDQAYLASLLDSAMAREVHQKFDFSDLLAASVARKISEKLHDYALQRLSWATTERRAARMTQLIADAKLLKSLSAEAGELAEQFQIAADGATDRAPVEEIAAEAAA